MIEAHPRLRTRLCDLFGIRHPVVQTGMGYVSNSRLTAATSAAGGLGILAGGTLSRRELEESIAAVKERTEQPFGVNLRADHPEAPAFVELLIRERVKVASFALAPKPELIARLKEGGVLVVPSIGARRHAEKVAAWGADAVVVQGAEGGGHTGQVPTSLLVPQVVDAVEIPVIAAGGYFDGRGLVAALAYGAAGIAMGTRFLLTEESPVADSVKRRYLAAAVTDAVVTKEIDGVPQRVLDGGPVAALERSNPVTRLGRAARNAVAFKRVSGTPWRDLVREGLAMKRSRELSWSQVVMAANAPVLYRAGLHEGREDVGVAASGQVVGLIDDVPSCEELVARIVAEATATLRRLERLAADEGLAADEAGEKR
ncbi:MAG TPA: nitronate monooxygenase [Solirubrobacterales bacterium]|nr:nitronate monooxygenase [Solirubrobacterales bacterium]